ncbi:CG2681 [Drosophila busckii]|uniref:RING-type E3 ubiquitin transferase n=1 Tax=Drosophila busckii TaxID=30019 RepID=A0A0M4EIM2_DROBS|nr:E3 ubiquitin-protein ligase siah-1 [Drosophila busckii]ALC48778.1 CG2681 [Drosophila busckii]
MSSSGNSSSVEEKLKNGHSTGESLKPLASEQINAQRRLFLNSTINEEHHTDDSQQAIETVTATVPETAMAMATATLIAESPTPELRKRQPPCTLGLNVKYATLPSPSVAATTAMRSPLSPPPKPPMLSRTRSTGSGDSRTPLTNGESLAQRHSVNDAVLAAAAAAPAPASNPPSTITAATSAAQATVSATPDTATPSISAKHYESLIEELRCPGCASPMKSPVLLCKSGHSICEQCTRILLMCPLCKEGFTNCRSLTVEALCAKAHFGCSHASGGCQARMPVALLPWHEQQCIYKPMKCFMGRVWGECKWQGREVQWKQHLEEQHTDKLFRAASVDLVWDMSQRSKPLTGYYVFQAHEEMFNFYEIHDKQRILFTMTCTSNRRESKYNYAYEVTLLQPDNDALSLTQKFPVHSEYDKDILMDGTCVSINVNELARFLDEDRLLHYRVSVVAVNSPRRIKPARQSAPMAIDYQQSGNVAVNGKSVPASMIITRTYKEALGETGTEECQELERKWGTPQLHFNRKYLRNSSSAEASTPAAAEDVLTPLTDKRSAALYNEDKLSLCSNTSYTKKVSQSLRRSFRTLKVELAELRPFAKKSSPTKSSPSSVDKAVDT